MADAEVETTPGEDNDDSWLYGDGPGELRDGAAPSHSEKDQPQPAVNPDLTDEGKEKDTEDNDNELDENDESHFNDEHFADVGREEQDKTNGDAASQGHGDSDSDDSDDVKVTIGDIKSGPQAYASLNIKRGVGVGVGVGLVAAGGAEKARGPTPGKVTLEDLDGPGSINGVPALEYNIDTIEDKPWNKPGADISDYFNYGFNEVTWSAYCERQRRMRVNEAGVSLLAGAPPRAPPDLHRARPVGPPRNDEGMLQSPMGNNYQVRENTIQVMTAERREYGRTHPPPRDLPPPDYFAPPPEHYFPPPHDRYDEPWGHPEQSGWAPSDIKELTPGPMGPAAMGPPPGLGPPGVGAHVPGAHLMAAPYGSPYRPHPHPHPQPHPHPAPSPQERERDRDRDRDRPRERDERERRERDRREDEERDRERERSRSIKPDRIREKSYRRERSRSRSRRHKSRSRSPRPRERERERERERDRDRSRDRERSLKPKPKDSKEKEDDK